MTLNVSRYYFILQFFKYGVDDCTLKQNNSNIPPRKEK